FARAEQTRGHQDRDDFASFLELSNGVPVFGSEDRFSSRQSLYDDEIGGGVRLDYHRPISMRWQADGQTSLAYGGPSRRQIGVNSSADARYLLADRWTAAVQVFQQATSLWRAGRRTEPLWFLSGSASLSYWVEDRWSLDLSYLRQESQQHNVDFF